MKTIKLILAIGIMLMMCPSTVKTQVSNEKAGNEDKTLSPYFFVKSDDSSIDQLPLKATSAEVNISGIIADIKIVQVYENKGKKPLEAIYVFPASTRAAVYAMTMKIGDRVLVAKIQEREQARKDYEEAKQQGKSTSLLEEDRPNVFKMNVGNIMPGDTIRIELRYTELLIPENGIYEFVYPTVVGPRYSNKDSETASSNDKWVSNPYTHQGEAPLYTFDIKTKIEGGVPVKDVVCNTHKVNVKFESKSCAVVNLDKSEEYGGNRDYILKYRLKDNKIQSGIILYSKGGEKYFLAMIQPPERPSIDEIPPREYIFVMDVSGSMSGYPLETSKKVLKDLVNNLRPIDKFNLMLFAGNNLVLSDKSMPATAENLKKAIDMIENQSGGGGTEILPALQRALALEKSEGYSRTFVIATDGYVDVEKDVFDLIKKNLSNANFFAFGIGTSVNRYIIEGMAHIGMGEPFIVTKENEAKAAAEKFRKYVQSPVLTDIKINFGNFSVYDVEPISVPDVFAERPVMIYGKWKGDASGTIQLTGKNGSGNYTCSINVGDAKPSEENIALKYIWVRQKIRELGDYKKLGETDEIKKEITELGLKYNLLTEYTSFIAIDSLVRNKGGKQTTVKQPLPMPEGVSDNAIGDESKATGSGYGRGGGVNKSYGSGKAKYTSKPQGNYSATAPMVVKEEVIGQDSVFAEVMPEYAGGEKA
ncbi:MAG: VIT and VWA domain-containing protein, partial [Bacteroidales bacterium]|nr:VIT and VWA domain-containing protein [Bacteroidales bacterium]